MFVDRQRRDRRLAGSFCSSYSMFHENRRAENKTLLIIVPTYVSFYPRCMNYSFLYTRLERIVVNIERNSPILSTFLLFSLFIAFSYDRFVIAFPFNVRRVSSDPLPHRRNKRVRRTWRLLRSNLGDIITAEYLGFYLRSMLSACRFVVARIALFSQILILRSKVKNRLGVYSCVRITVSIFFRSDPASYRKSSSTTNYFPCVIRYRAQSNDGYRKFFFRNALYFSNTLIVNGHPRHYEN